MMSLDQQRPANRLTRLLPLDSSTRVLNQSSVSESLVEIPGALAHTQGRSMVDWKVTVPIIAARSIRIHQIHSCLSRCVLETRNGTRLMDLPFAAEYLKTVTPVACRFTTLQGDKDYNWSGPKGKGSSVFHSNQVDSSTSAIDSNSARLTATSELIASVTSQAPDMAYTDFQYITQSAVGGALVLSYSVPFSDFYKTIMADMDPIYMNQSLNLRLTWNSIDNLGFIGSDAGDYATNIAPIVPTVPGTVTVSDIRVYLAVQVNQAINDQLIAQTNSAGWRRKIDYVHSFLQTTAATNNSSVQTRLNRAQGEKLQAVLTTYMHASNNAATRYDHSNVGSRMVSTIYSQLNSKNLQEIILSCAENEDYEFLRPLLKGSVVNQSSDTYKYNFFWLDQWNNTPLCDEYGSKDGLDLSTEVLYTVTSTHPNFNALPASYRVFTFAICTRDLIVSPGGVDVQVI